MSEQYQNLTVSALSATVNSTSNPVTFSISGGTGSLFPPTTNGPFRVVVMNTDGTNAEVMLCTTLSGDSLTCSRGAGATGEVPTPIMLTHAAGSVVAHNLTAGAMNAIRDDIHATGTLSGLPTAPIQGDRYFTTSRYGIALTGWNNSAAANQGPMMTLYSFEETTP